MNTRRVEHIANAVLYEGYLLYPYRRSALKNRKPFNFGVLYPKALVEPKAQAGASTIETECLVVGNALTRLDFKVRFLQLIAREPGELAVSASGARPGPGPDLDSRRTFEAAAVEAHGWPEAVEREVSITGCALDSIAVLLREFRFPTGRSEAGGEARGPVVESHSWIDGLVEISAAEAGDGLFKIRVQVSNLGSLGQKESSYEEILLRSLVSTHTILMVEGGEFVSLLDPPERFKQAAAQCRNLGTYPVLAGEEGRRDVMLSSPIILYDYPEIAPQSPGEFFDSTEIDEMLALRMITLTEDEKREVRNGNERARQILERTETLAPEQWMKLHGALRNL